MMMVMMTMFSGRGNKNAKYAVWRCSEQHPHPSQLSTVTFSYRFSSVAAHKRYWSRRRIYFK